MTALFSANTASRYHGVRAIAVAALTAVCFAAQASIKADCGNNLKNCKDKTITASSPGYISDTPVYFTGNTKLTLSASNVFNTSPGDYHFRDKTELTITAEKAINSSATYQLRASTGVTDARVLVNINASRGISQAKLLAQQGSNAVVNITAARGLDGGTQGFNKNTTLNISAAEGIFSSNGLTAADATINLNATDAFTDRSMSVDPKQNKPRQLSLKKNSRLNVNQQGALSGGRINVQDDSGITVTAKGGISGGELLFNQRTTLQANASQAITGSEQASKQIFQAGTAMTINASQGLNGGSQIFNSATLTVNASQGISGGYQTLAGTSVLNALAAQAINGGRMQFKDNARFNAQNRQTVTAGSQDFLNNSVLNANGGDTLYDGSQNFKDNSVLNANSAGSITGQSRQTFSGSATLNINHSQAINGGKQTVFKDNARLNINAAQGISGGNLLFDGNSVINARTPNSISGGAIRLKGSAILHASQPDALNNTGGALVFTESSSLNASATHAISGPADNNNKYIFQAGSVMNIQASAALNGGNQIFNSATLNIHARRGIADGYQILAGDTVVNALAGEAISGGQMKFQDNAVFKAEKPGAISGGSQNFFNNSLLQASGGNTLAGGSQNFHDDSVLNASSPGSITGSSRQIFSGNAVLNASVSDSINGGSSTTFKDHARLNLTASRAVTGGHLLFDGNSQLNILAENAISGAELRLKGDAVINLQHPHALPDTTLKPEGNARIILNSAQALDHSNQIVFTQSYDTTEGSALDVNGYSLELGSISASGDKARILNSGQQNAVLTSGLYQYGIAAGESYLYPEFLRSRSMRPDAVVASALADITRNAGFSLLAKFSDRVIPQTSSIVQQRQGIWLQTELAQQAARGEGVSRPRWQGKTTSLLLGADLFPASDDQSHKLGVYGGFLSSRASIDGKLVSHSSGKTGQYQLTGYAAAIYWRQLAQQGWYTSTTLQINRYQGDVSSTNSLHKASTGGHGLILAFETGYPLAFTESLTLMPRLHIRGQTLKLRNYQFDDLAVSTAPDKQLLISAGARLYRQHTSLAGQRYNPWLDVELVSRLAARDRNNLHIISRDYSKSVLTSYSGAEIKLATGVTISLTNRINYYISLGLTHGLHDSAGTLWNGAMGINLNW